MNNPKILAALSILAFAISATFSIILMTSGTVGNLSFVLAVGMALVMELSKCGFAYMSLVDSFIPKGIRLVLGLVAIILVGTSIFASAGYIQNQANATKNISMKDSSQYKQLEKTKAVQESLFVAKQKEIDGLESLKIQQQSEGNKIIEAMPRNYIDRRNAQRSLTQKQIEQTQNTINQKNIELGQLGNVLQSPIDVSNLKLSDENGYSAMFKQISDNPEKAEMIFFVGLGVVFEIVAVLLAFLAQLKRKPISRSQQNGTNPPSDKKPLPTKTLESIEKPKQEVFEGGRLKGMPTNKMDNVTPFKPRPESLESHEKPKFEVSEDEIETYLKFIMNPANQKTPGKAPGRDKISKGTGIPQEKCRTINGILKHRGIVITIGNETRILKEVV